MESKLLEENEVRDAMLLKNNPSNLSEDYYQDAGQAYLDNMKHTPLAQSLRKGNSTHRMSGNLSLTNDKIVHRSNRKHSPLEVPLGRQLLGGQGRKSRALISVSQISGGSAPPQKGAGQMSPPTLLRAVDPNVMTALNHLGKG